jgi:hypothetical protein
MPMDQAYPAEPTGRGREAGPAPFLVYTDQTLTEQERPDEVRRWLVRLPCMSRALPPGEPRWVNQETGEMRPLRCQRNGCPDCIGVNAWRRSLAVRYVEPTHEFTVTTTDLHGAASPWPVVQDRLRVLRQAAKRDRVELGAFGTYIEQGGKAGMTHAHMVVKDGGRLDFDWLRRRLESAGFGSRFTYSRIKTGADFASYVGKGFAAYATKGYRVDAEDALRMNGGRVGHFSRGFFPDGVRRAEVDSLATLRESSETEPSPWICTVVG